MKFLPILLAISSMATATAVNGNPHRNKHVVKALPGAHLFRRQEDGEEGGDEGGVCLPEMAECDTYKNDVCCEGLSCRPFGKVLDQRRTHCIPTEEKGACKPEGEHCKDYSDASCCEGFHCGWTWEQKIGGFSKHYYACFPDGQGEVQGGREPGGASGGGMNGAVDNGPSDGGNDAYPDDGGSKDHDCEDWKNCNGGIKVETVVRA